MKSEYTKFIILTCLVSFLTALVLGGIAHQRMKNIVLEATISTLASDSELVSLGFKKRYDQIAADINILSTIPDVISFDRGVVNHEYGTQDHLSAQIGVENIFISIMRKRDYYTQMRILDHTGQELVRINKTEDNFERVSQDQLQSKSKESYYKEGVKLNPDEMYHSEVTYNREHGVVTPDRLPTQRFVKGVYASDGSILGMLVINVDYPSFINQVLEEYLFDRDIIVSNHLEDTMVYDRETGETQFYFHDDQQKQKLITSIHELGVDKEVLINDVDVLYAHIVNVDPLNQQAFLKIILRVPEKELLEPVYKESSTLLVFFIMFSAVVLLVVIMATKRFVKPMVEQEKALRMDAEHSNAELEEFAYRTSHDLRSPLVSSISLLDFSVEAMESGDYEKSKKGLHLVQSSLVKLELLVRDILELTKTKNLQEDIQEINFEEIIDIALQDLSHMDNFERLDIQKHLNYDGKLSSQKSRIVLIVSNLISNAIKYQDKEKQDSFIKISTHQYKDSVVFEIEDNGLGIPERQRQNLFEMFKRFHTKVSYGSGLGLYMIKKSTSIIGGSILYEPKVDGSIFKLTIPKN